jgi:hypothetical protein
LLPAAALDAVGVEAGEDCGGVGAVFFFWVVLGGGFEEGTVVGPG